MAGAHANVRAATFLVSTNNYNKISNCGDKQISIYNLSTEREKKYENKIKPTDIDIIDVYVYVVYDEKTFVSLMINSKLEHRNQRPLSYRIIFSDSIRNVDYCEVAISQT